MKLFALAARHFEVCAAIVVALEMHRSGLDYPRALNKHLDRRALRAGGHG
jgi:hypothetical protein